MRNMTSRERVLCALRHEEPDRMPIDFGSMRSTGINAMAYNDLKRFLGLTEGATRVYDVKQLLAEPEKAILDRFQGDVVQLHRMRPSLGLKIDRWKPSKLMDGSDCEVPEDFNPALLEDGSEAIFDNKGNMLSKRPKDGIYFDEVYTPLRNAEDPKDLEDFPVPSITREELDYLKAGAKQLYEKTEYAILGAVGVSIFEKGLKDFGYEEYLINSFTNVELIEAYLTKLTDAYIRMLDQYIDAVGDYIQIIQVNDDLGMQNAPIIPPEKYRSLFKPYHKRIFEFIKSKNKNLSIFIHCCGSIYDLIPDLIEAGIDILNPVQINATKMDPKTLKREFGRHLTFWGGGCSTQTTLTFGSVEDVIKEAQEMIGIFAPGGGYVFNQVHNIQAGVAPEKIVALYDTAIKLGNYPIR